MIILKLLFGGLWKALSGVLSLIGRNPWPCAVIALCGLSGWLWHGKQKAVAQIGIEIAAHKQTKAFYIAAQAKAVEDQNTADMIIYARNQARAKESEDEHRKALADVRNAAERYAANNRVRPPAITACRATGGADAPALPDYPPPPDGPGSSADLVAVTREDFDKLTGATLQAAERGHFLQSLIDDGLAIPGVMSLR